ncbi:MAG: HPP family protein [Methanomicrobiales archaeon]
MSMIKKLVAKDFMITDIHVSAPDDLVAAAKLKMVRCNIGAVPIVGDKKLVGLLTHRDVLLAGSEALGLKVEDLMSKDLIVVDKNTPIRDITKIMASTGFQRIPVVDEGYLVGLITQSSIIRAFAEYLD